MVNQSAASLFIYHASSIVFPHSFSSGSVKLLLCQPKTTNHQPTNQPWLHDSAYDSALRGCCDRVQILHTATLVAGDNRGELTGWCRLLQTNQAMYTPAYCCSFAMGKRYISYNNNNMLNVLPSEHVHKCLTVANRTKDTAIQALSTDSVEDCNGYRNGTLGG